MFILISSKKNINLIYFKLKKLINKINIKKIIVNFIIKNLLLISKSKKKNCRVRDSNPRLAEK